MKKLLVVLVFLLAGICNPQTKNIVWIFDPQVGSETINTKLQEMCDVIGGKTDIEKIILTGNLSIKSTEEEFQSLKTITSDLPQQCYFIPGTNDYKWLKGNSGIFKDVFGDDKFFYKDEQLSIIGITSAVERRGEGGHFKREDLEWLELLKDSINNDEPVILFLNQPINSSIDNWFKLTNLLANKNVVAVFSTEGESNKLFETVGVPSFSAKGLTAKNNDWSYFVFETRNDSLIFLEVSKTGKTNIIQSFPLTTIKHFTPVDSLQLKDDKNILLWQYDLKSSVNNSLVVKDNFVFTLTPEGKVTCLTKSGSVKWQTEIEGSSISNLIKDGDLLVLGTLQGDLISLNANTGEIFQTIGVGEPITSRIISATIEVPEGKIRAIIFGTLNGNLYCYNIYSFELIWQNSSATDMIESEPLVADDRIIINSHDLYLYCVDKRSGILNWKWTNEGGFYSSPARCSPVSDGKNIFITTTDKNIYAIDLLLGTTNWKKDVGGWESIGLSSDKKNLFIKNFKDKFIVLSTDGKVIKEIDLKNGYDTTPIKISEWNKNLLIPLKNGNVKLIDKEYKLTQLFFAGSSRLNDIQHFYDDVFVTSNADGMIYCFKIN